MRIEPTKVMRRGKGEAGSGEGEEIEAEAGAEAEAEGESGSAMLKTKKRKTNLEGQVPGSVPSTDTGPAAASTCPKGHLPPSNRQGLAGTPSFLLFPASSGISWRFSQI